MSADHRAKGKDKPKADVTQIARVKTEVEPPKGVEAQPVSGLDWLPASELHANGYNPNHVALPELRLLKISIMEDGWTQPIVARPDGEIVDGFHRWTVSQDPQVAEMTGGLVPVVILREDVSEDHQIMSTIRHNRARGSHFVRQMAEIVIELIDDQGLEADEVAHRLQMDPEEVKRLYDRGSMRKRHAGDDFNVGWTFTGSNRAADVAQADMDRKLDPEQGTRMQ